MKYGRSKLNGRYPSLRYKNLKDESGEFEFGFYEDTENAIYVNSKLHKTLEEVVRTVIHEYAHYRYHSMPEYQRLAKIYAGNEHPHEVDAYRIEDRDYKKCMRDLKITYGIE